MSYGEYHNLLRGLGVAEAVELFHEGTRDNPDIKVFRCKETDALFLDQHWENPNAYPTRKTAEELQDAPDNKRRGVRLFYSVADMRWLDVGSGPGGLIRNLHYVVEEVSAVEPLEACREELSGWAKAVYPSLQSCPVEAFDVITMMHVLEHMRNPIRELKYAHRALRRGGKIYIEVPHARDFLIQVCPAFRKHTFWSEHRILHTSYSLTKFLEAAGFKNITVEGVQRYPISNHIKWLTGIDQDYTFLDNAAVSDEYTTFLHQAQLTDTLWAVATT